MEKERFSIHQIVPKYGKSQHYKGKYITLQALLIWKAEATQMTFLFSEIFFFLDFKSGVVFRLA